MSPRSLRPRAQAMFEVIERYRASGSSQKAFCQSEGLALSTFQYWLARYRKHHASDALKENQQLFIELKPAGQPYQPGGSSGAVTVRYPNGVTVSLGAPLDPQVLHMLIATPPATGKLL